MLDTNGHCPWPCERGSILVSCNYLRDRGDSGGWQVDVIYARGNAKNDFSTLPPRSNTPRRWSNLDNIWWKYRILFSNVLFKFHSGRIFLVFLQGTFCDSAPDCPPDFTSFTMASETVSGMPISVGLCIVSGSLLTFCHMCAIYCCSSFNITRLWRHIWRLWCDRLESCEDTGGKTPLYSYKSRFHTR